MVITKNNLTNLTKEAVSRIAVIVFALQLIQNKMRLFWSIFISKKLAFDLSYIICFAKS